MMYKSPLGCLVRPSEDNSSSLAKQNPDCIFDFAD